MPASSSPSIRPLASPADFQAVEEMQRVVWEGDPVPVPASLLMVVAHNGGVALGAFDGGRLIGFVFGFIGSDELGAGGRASAGLKHHSHMLAVLPGYRDQQVGYLLKLAQRDFVMGQGIERVTWTYDPLEGRNAHLNIGRLGVVCRTYLRDVYGEMRDAMNRGLPSDRFIVDWWVGSKRVAEKVAGRGKAEGHIPPPGEAEVLNASRAGLTDEVPQPAEKVRPIAGERVLVEIPGDFQRLKAEDMGLARAWREQTRAIFEAAFAGGYTVTDFWRTGQEVGMRSFYTLSKQPGAEYED